MSDAYYAVFHAITEELSLCFKEFSSKDPDNNIRDRLYRFPDHSIVAKNCKSIGVGRFNEALQDFADTFGSLQQKRELADYGPTGVMEGHEFASYVADAARSIECLENTEAELRRAFVLFICLKKR